MESLGTGLGVAHLSVTANPPAKQAAGKSKFSAASILSAACVAITIAGGCTNANISTWQELQFDAEKHLRSGYFSRAETEAQAAVKITKLNSVGDIDRATCLLTLGTAQLQCAQYDLAEASLSQAVTLVQTPNSNTAWLKSLLRAIPSVRNDELALGTILHGRLARLYTEEARFAQAKAHADEAQRIGAELYTVASNTALHPRNAKEIAWAYNKRLLYVEVLCSAAELARQTADYRRCRFLCGKASDILDSLHSQKDAANSDALSTLLDEEAMLDLDSGRYPEAVKLSQTALMASVSRNGWDSPTTFKHANTLVYSYVVEQHFQKAISLIEKYGLCETNSMRGHPVNCRSTLLHAISWTAVTHGKQSEAPSFEYVIKHDTGTFGVANPVLADDFEGYATYKLANGDTGGASDLLQRALEIVQSSLGSAHPRLVPNLNAQAGLSLLAGGASDLTLAEQYVRRSIDICSKNGLQYTPEWQRAMNILGIIGVRKHNEIAAQTAFQALSVAQLSGAPVSDSLLCGLKNYAALLRHTGKDAQAEQLEARIRQIESDAAFHEEAERYRQVGYLVMPDGG